MCLTVTYHSTSLRIFRAETQRKNLMVETETEVIEKLFLLSCSSRLFQSAFSYTPASPDQGWDYPQ